MSISITCTVSITLRLGLRILRNTAVRFGEWRRSSSRRGNDSRGFVKSRQVCVFRTAPPARTGSVHDELLPRKHSTGVISPHSSLKNVWVTHDT
jgi:hypothetical protein